MSIFRKTSLACPACKAAVEFDEVHSVNADRRPDLRLAILDDTFQQQVCPSCGRQFRLDPAFNLMDTRYGQWIDAAPLSELKNWKAREEHSRSLFNRAYGAEASEVAQEIGAGLTPRLTFGWPALREKLLAAEHQLDDAALELCKAVVMRNADSPVSARSELRLVDVTEDELILAWMLSADESPGPTLRLGRALYEEVAADADGDWDELKEDLANALFVDLNRLMIAGEAPRTPAEPPSGFTASPPETPPAGGASAPETAPRQPGAGAEIKDAGAAGVAEEPAADEGDSETTASEPKSKKPAGEAKKPKTKESAKKKGDGKKKK